MAIDVANDTPFNNPSAQPALVEMWRSAINKARTEIPPQPLLTTTIEANFDGGGVPLIVGLGGVIRVTFPCKILNCYIEAGSVTTTGVVPTEAAATIYLGLGQQGNWSGGSTPLYGGTVPTINGTEAVIDTTGWTTEDLQPGDLIPYGLLSFVGAATFITVSIGVRRVDVTGLGLSGVNDTGSNNVVDSNGNIVIRRG